MSDLADGSGHMPRRTRVGEGGAPVSGGLAIVLAVVAVVAGFLILRSISNGGETRARSAVVDAQPHRQHGRRHGRQHARRCHRLHGRHAPDHQHDAR